MLELFKASLRRDQLHSGSGFAATLLFPGPMGFLSVTNEAGMPPPPVQSTADEGSHQLVLQMPPF
ncbi:uncharacterized protein EI90DRAFT_3036000, partial [Cantharellus anzutake]|uniref:uncharacterized protein n=1 Tax=Cantharellus anzutake TaxID=1750568 RepID=UPI001903E294